MVFLFKNRIWSLHVAFLTPILFLRHPTISTHLQCFPPFSCTEWSCILSLLLLTSFPGDLSLIPKLLNTSNSALPFHWLVSAPQEGRSRAFLYPNLYFSASVRNLFRDNAYFYRLDVCLSTLYRTMNPLDKIALDLSLGPTIVLSSS